jgi:hypothetical protein
VKRGAGIVDVESEVAESLNYFRGVGSLLDPPGLGKLRASQPFTKRRQKKFRYQPPTAGGAPLDLSYQVSALGSPTSRLVLSSRRDMSSPFSPGTIRQNGTHRTRAASASS